MTILWSRFESTGTDNYSIKYGESCLRRHEQPAALATLDVEIQAVYSQSDRGWGWRISQEYSVW